MERWDVVVVGAGPAGCSLARELALAGARVLIVDRGELGRDKPCGEGLMPKGVRALVRAGLGHLLDGTPRFEGVRFHVAGRAAAGRFHDGAGRGVRRDRLDAALAIAAVTAGATLRTGAALRAVARGTDEGEEWRLALAPSAKGRGDGEIVRARFLVGADGVGSRVRRALGLDLPPTPRDRPRRRLALDESEGDGRVGLVGHVGAKGRVSKLVEIFYEPGWEVALTPVAGGQLSVAALVEPSRARELSVGAARWLGERLAEAGVPVTAPEPRTLRAVRLGSRASRVTTPGALLVGDAAGAVDPIVGCGISHALAEAPLAAQAILGALVVPSAAARLLEGYERALARLVRDGFLAARLALVCARHRTFGGAVARAAPAPLLDGMLALVGA